MFDRTGQARPQCCALVEDLLAASLPRLRQHQTEADTAFLTQGITFTVYGDEAGTERIFPYDLLPRIITASDGDLFGEGSYLQQEVKYERLLRADAKALALIRLEAGERHAHAIGAGQHAAEGVLADLVGHRGAFRVGVFVGEDDFRAGDHALRIAHRAAQCALVGLCDEA